MSPELKAAIRAVVRGIATSFSVPTAEDVAWAIVCTDALVILGHPEVRAEAAGLDEDTVAAFLEEEDLI